MKKIVMVVAQEKFQEDEYFIPRRYFEDNGYRVSIASIHPGIAEGYKGSQVNVDCTISDINTFELEALVIVGGFGCKNHLWDYKPLHNKLIEVYEQGKVIAAICLAPVCIVKTGLLKGEKATAYKNKTAQAEFVKAEVEYIDKPVHTNNRIITANGPKSSEAFAIEILNQLEG
jgi:protease I